MATEGKRGRAVVIRQNGGVEVLETVKDFSFPPTPEGEILVHVVSSSVNPVDIAILGGDVAGLVAEAPSGSKFKVGDKVYALLPTYIPQPGRLGTYAEYVAVKEDWLAAVPDALPVADAAGVPLVALTAWQALKAVEPKPGQRILIYAASGGVGHLAVQFAKHFGLYVVGTASSKNLDLVRGFGADEAVDYAGGADALRSLFAGSDATKFDILLDLIGGELLEVGRSELLRPGGAVTHVLNAGSDHAANARHAAAAADGTGPRWYSTLVQPSGAQLAEISQLFAAGKARLQVAQRFPLEEVAKGHEIVAGKHPGGKVILTI